MKKVEIAKKSVFGVKLCFLDKEALRRVIWAEVDDGHRLRIEGVNVSKVVDIKTDERLKSAINDAEILHLDGMGILIAARLLGIRGGTRYAGIDLMIDLLSDSTKKDKNVFLLGGKTDVVERTANILMSQYTGLKIVGTHNGYFNQDQEKEVALMVERSGADILFVGITSPKKELFVNGYWNELNVDIALGVGGAFDVICGDLKRAPQWMQLIGLEWFFRITQEPTRLVWRYIKTNSIFLLLLMMEVLKRIYYRKDL